MRETTAPDSLRKLRPALLIPALILLAGLAPTTARGQEAATALAIGETLPEAARTLTLAAVDETAEADTDSSAGKTSLGDWRGSEGLLVVFASNTCPYVTDWADRFPRLAELARERQIGMVVVNSNARKRKTDDSPGAMRAFAEEHLGALPYLIDEGSELADLLGAQRTPEALLFDGDWTLVYRGQIDDHSGPVENVEQHYLRDAMSVLIDGALADGGGMPEATAPLGCKILRPRQRRPRPTNPGP